MSARELAIPSTARLASAIFALTTRRSYLLVGLMMLFYIVFQGATAVRMHEAFVTSAADMSTIDQSAWNSQHGRILELTEGTRSVPNHGEHLEPVWIAAGLVYHIWDDVRALLWMQSVALALGALPVFWLARDRWGQARARRGDPARPDNGAGLLFAAVYLLSPFVGRTNSAEVHSTAFAIAPMLLAVVWALRGQWRRVAPLVLLLLLTREDVGLMVAALGLWLAVARRAWRPAAVLIVSGLAGTAIAVRMVGHFAAIRFPDGQQQSPYFSRYAAFGDGPVELLWGMATRWDLWLELFSDPWRLTFLRDFVASTGGLMLLSPVSWLLFAPHFVLNALSAYFGQHGGLQHYPAPLVPGLIVSAILGGARALEWGRSVPAWRVALLSLALVGAVWSARAAIWQPLARSWIVPPVSAHHRLLADFAAMIPPRAPMSADEQLHPHFAHRPDIYRFPYVGDNAEWILVDVTTNTTMHPADLQAEIAELLAGNWGIAAARDGYLLLRRGELAKEIPKAFLYFGQSHEAPEVPLHVRLGDFLEVVGYDIQQDFWGRVSVRWTVRPLQPLPAAFMLDAGLLDEAGQPVANTSGQPITFLLWHPLEKWQVGERYIIETLYRETASPFFPAIAARIDGSLLPTVECDASCTGETARSPARWEVAGDWTTGGAWRLRDNHAIRAEAGWRRWAPPAGRSSNGARWPIATLGGWNLSRDGETVRLTLHWQATGDRTAPTQRFVHVVPEAGEPVPIAQADGPLGGDYAVARWAAGEWVSEEVTLTIPSGAPSNLRLLVGLYDLSNGERLPVEPDAGGRTFAVTVPAE